MHSSQDVYRSTVLIESDYLDEPLLVLFSNPFYDKRPVPDQDVSGVSPCNCLLCVRDEYCLSEPGIGSVFN